jgi:hypothetical protein
MKSSLPFSFAILSLSVLFTACAHDSKSSWAIERSIAQESVVTPGKNLAAELDVLRKHLIDLEKGDAECDSQLVAKKCYKKIVSTALDATAPVVKKIEALIPAVDELSASNLALKEKVKLQEQLVELLKKQIADIATQNKLYSCEIRVAPDVFTAVGATEEIARAKVASVCAERAESRMVFMCEGDKRAKCKQVN